MTEESDDSDDNGRPSSWWGLAAVAAGIAVAVLAGVPTSEGAGEISGVAAASLVLGVMALRDLRYRRWFWPYLAAIALLHVAVIALFVAPRIHVGSKGYLLLMWPDFFLIAGLGLLIERLTRGAAQDADDLPEDAQGA